LSTKYSAKLFASSFAEGADGKVCSGVMCS